MTLKNDNPVNIIVAGIGGAGSNMVERTLEIKGIEAKITPVVINTDIQALSTAKAKNKIQIGEKLTRGLGAGMKPDVGEKAALESELEIIEAIKGADLLIVVAGLGGGTGTGAAPLVAEMAKTLGILTVSIVVKPFSFEGRRRMKLANAGFDKIVDVSDSVITIYNENLLTMADKSLGIKEAFLMVDNILAKAVEGIVGVVVDSAANSVNLDFSDFKTIMKHSGMSLMGNSNWDGEDSAIEAVKAAINSPLLGRSGVDEAKGVIIHFKNHTDYPLLSIAEAMEFIEDAVDEDADIIFGTTNDDAYPLDYVEVTVIATGFEYENPKKKAEAEKINQEKKIINKEQLFGNHRELASDTDNIDIPTFLRKSHL